MLKKTHALFCYCTVIGWMVAYIIYCNKREERSIVQFHLQQSFGVGLLSLRVYGSVVDWGVNMFEYSLPSLINA